MRLLCPFCQKAISVADSEAGKAVNCPECGQQFAAPQLYTPAPTAEPPVEKTSFPVPAPVPETYTPEPIHPREPLPPLMPAAPSASSPTQAPPIKPARVPDMPPPDREMSGYSNMKSISLDPKVIRFVPAAALFIVFVLTFFSWNGLYPGGYPAYTQGAWYGLVGSMSRDAVADDELRVGEVKFGDDLDKNLHGSLWLLPFLLFLFPALALAFGGPIVEMAKIKIPPNLENIWKYRPALLAALALMMCLSLTAQWVTGFGMEKAVSKMVEERFAEKKAQANTPEKMQRWEMNVDAERGKYHFRTTIWLRLALLSAFIAFLGAAAETCLMMRDKKAPPRIGVMW
jgi:hypothetical protein